MAKKSSVSIKGMAEMGAIAAGVAAAAGAGYYFYASKDAVKNRKIASKWAADMKKEVIKKAETIKNLDQKEVVAMISEAANRYEQIRSIDKRDVLRAAEELKKNWKNIAEEVGKKIHFAKNSTTSEARSVVKGAKKVAKKMVKKVAKKVSK